MFRLKLYLGQSLLMLMAGLLMGGCTPKPTATRDFSQQPTQTLTVPLAVATPTPSLATARVMPSLMVTSTAPAGITPSPRPLLTAKATCGEDNGKIEGLSLSTPLLGQPLKFNIYLPPCYASQTDRHYPVLYLLHGQTYTDDQWIRLGITSLADRLITSGEISPLLVVMPYDADWRQPDVSHFGDAVTDALLPWVDSHYRTTPERASRAIGGVSRGAAWAVHLGLSRWQLFGAIGAHSLPIFWADSDHISHWLDAISAGEMPRIYIDISRNDEELSSAVDFENMINQRGIPHEWYLRPGYHGEAYWQLHLEEYLRWYVLNW